MMNDRIHKWLQNLMTNSLEIKAITDICTTCHPMKTYTRWSQLLLETGRESSPSWDHGDKFDHGSHPSWEKGQATENKFMFWRADSRCYGVWYDGRVMTWNWTDGWGFYFYSVITENKELNINSRDKNIYTTVMHINK